MTDDDLSSLVDDLRAFGTDVANVEAKRARDALPRSVRETLPAFANTAGGVLILGLDEEHGFVATGVTDPKRVADALSALAAEEMEPPLRPAIGLHRFEGVVLVVAEVPELDVGTKPCFSRGTGKAYVRVGDADRQLSPYEVHLFAASRGQPAEDEEPVPKAGLDALDRDLTRRFCERVRARRPSLTELDDTTVLRRFKVLVPDGRDGECPSLAGLLALGSWPQEFFPQLNLTFVHYPTTTGALVSTGERFLDNQSLDGPIPVILRDAMLALRKNMTRRAVVLGPGRLDIDEYPEAALREAIVNALVHRDLSPFSRGTYSGIRMYPDRVSIFSAGGLFGSLTVDDLGVEGAWSTRNQVLMRILEDVQLPTDARPVCENRGSGIPTMIRALRDAGMTPPVFRDHISRFSVTFPNHTLMSGSTVRWINALGEATLTESQVVALALLRDDDLLDNARYRAATGLDSRVVTSELQDLVARELIVQVGERRWAKYVLSKRAASVDPDAPGSGSTHQARADRRDEILAALAAGPRSRAELAEATGLTDKTVSRWLRILRQEGRLEITTDSARSQHARYRRRPEPKQGNLFGC
jgi:ATP-dependent DNA helicase RecG